jgi:hypothetical protein
VQAYEVDGPLEHSSLLITIRHELRNIQFTRRSVDPHEIQRRAGQLADQDGPGLLCAAVEAVLEHCNDLLATPAVSIAAQLLTADPNQLSSTGEAGEVQLASGQDRSAYRVDWTITLPGPSARRAAEEALEAILADQAHEFTVTDTLTGQQVTIDLNTPVEDEPENPAATIGVDRPRFVIHDRLTDTTTYLYRDSHDTVQPAGAASSANHAAQDPRVVLGSLILSYAPAGTDPGALAAALEHSTLREVIADAASPAD